MPIGFPFLDPDYSDGAHVVIRDGVIAGIAGETGSGADTPPEGAVRIGPDTEWPSDPPAAGVWLDHAFSRLDPLRSLAARRRLEQWRRQGIAIALRSHDDGMLTSMCDEVLWFDGPKLAGRGHPTEMLAAYRQSLAGRIREWGRQTETQLDPSLRRGDGRARLVEVETLDASGNPSSVWRNGELAAVRIGVEFTAPVEDPVVGMMIRTRVGFEVFGTNTELEALKLGPVAAGQRLDVTFAFEARLCPAEYTLTAASHDPDGTWHDWVEDAVAITVAANRYTAGVADLRARVSFVKS